MESAPRWFGVRTVNEHVDRKRGRDRLYEERVVLVRACSFDEAIAKAEEEAGRYCAEDTRFLEYSMAFEMFEPPGDGQEVFSLMRNSRLEPARYIDRFFDTGRERAGVMQDEGPERQTDPERGAERLSRSTRRRSPA